MIEITDLSELQTYLRKEKLPVILFLHAPWCGNCRNMYPVVDRLNDKYRDRIVFVKVNTDNAKEISSVYDVSGVPKFVSIKNGKMINNFSGASPEKIDIMIMNL
jgi:thioredoxin-like negative regulator of GroEL